MLSIRLSLHLTSDISQNFEPQFGHLQSLSEPAQTLRALPWPHSAQGALPHPPSQGCDSHREDKVTTSSAFKNPSNERH